jgi:protein-disulfide isomerase
MSEPPEYQVSTDSPVEEVRPEKKAALTITIQSWVTPIVGVVMLVVGLLGGYYVRPLLAPPPASSTTASSQTSGDTQDAAASQAALMEAVVAQTRHFTGDPDAPVTIVEFGDFQ